MAYPSWRYFPSNAAPPEWVSPLVGVIGSAESTISTETTRTGLSSDEVLAVLAPGLVELGFLVEDGKGRLGKVRRPVLFGENGLPTLTYEVDAAHSEHGIVVEIEAGRGARGNAEYRDLVRTSLILDANFLVLAQPLAYRFKSGAREGTEHAYLNTVNLLEAIYASQRLACHSMACCSSATDRVPTLVRLGAHYGVPAVARAPVRRPDTGQYRLPGPVGSAAQRKPRFYRGLPS